MQLPKEDKQEKLIVLAKPTRVNSIYKDKNKLVANSDKNMDYSLSNNSDVNKYIIRRNETGALSNRDYSSVTKYNINISPVIPPRRLDREREYFPNNTASSFKPKHSTKNRLILKRNKIQNILLENLSNKNSNNDEEEKLPKILNNHENPSISPIKLNNKARSKEKSLISLIKNDMENMSNNNSSNNEKRLFNLDSKKSKTHILTTRTGQMKLTCPANRSVLVNNTVTKEMYENNTEAFMKLLTSLNKKTKFMNKRAMYIDKLNSEKKNNAANVQNENDKKYPTANIFLEYNKYPKPKNSSKTVCDIIKTYSVNSYQGIVRNSNEDKVAIILSVRKPKNIEKEWPEHVSYLAIYDGHNGSSCSNYLQDKLHNYIFKSKYFPKEPEKAIINGFEKCERLFINNVALENNDKSGSCALILLLMNNVLYIANCGDSRALVSYNHGNIIEAINKEHKPNSEGEKERIIENGGSVFKKNFLNNQNLADLASIRNDKKLQINHTNHVLNNLNDVYGVMPGGLSVSRAFGDIYSKMVQLGGKSGTIIAVPDIIKIDFDDKEKRIDFIMLGSSGIFNYMSVDDAGKSAWNVIDNYNNCISKLKLYYNDMHELSGGIVDMVIKTALVKGSLDNVTAIFVGFEGYENALSKVNDSESENISTYINDN